MTKLLDARTSQNASTANSMSISFTAINAPQLWGQQTLNLSGGTAFTVRVEFAGVIALQQPLVPVATTATVIVVRGTTPSDLIIFSAALNLSTALTGPQLLTFAGSDFNAPNISPVTYTAFVSVNALGVTRVGPESFNLAAYSD
ncbi:hypothetical protein O9H85_14360 [Paenibacillus filicis]|uniref:Uncharacterized protein n=1 Tax=Paenibacillus gyeongsangnamensis TaxID=3388067 RepID=A0ABT4Q9P1_9BACL|nr:hypothetical protein [Paenibacillus filicis]MCZ8513596.1 hypothetical protein [Paenibacillus filicis]